MSYSIVNGTDFEVFKSGVYNPLGTAGVTEVYIYGDGVTYAQGIYYTGSAWILPAGWNRVKSMHGAFTTIVPPPTGGFNTDWVRAFNIRAPSATPTVTSIVRSDTTGSNILAPFYAVVHWTNTSTDVGDQVYVEWFQNGASVGVHLDTQAAGQDQSPVVYSHGDIYRVMVGYYDPDSGRTGPIYDSGNLTY